MLPRYFLLSALMMAAAAAPLPELRIEPTAGGSFFYVKNTAAQPLTAYLIELVDYPGSHYSYYQDDATGERLAPGAETKIRVANMTVGAVPDYVKMQAAVYADGSTAGAPEKVAAILNRRHSMLEITNELIAHLEKPGVTADDVAKWAQTLPATSRAQALQTAARLKTKSAEEVLTELQTSQKALQSAKP